VSVCVCVLLKNKEDIALKHIVNLCKHQESYS